MRKVLKDIVGLYGNDVFANPTQFKNSIGDALGNMGVTTSETKRIRSLLNIAIIEMKAFTRLQASRDKNENYAVENLISEMDSDYAVKNESARDVIKCIAEMLNQQEQGDNIPNVLFEYSVELWRGCANLSEILKFGNGSIIESDKLAGEPVEIVINNKSIAIGEIVIVDENFAIRINDTLNLKEALAEIMKMRKSVQRLDELLQDMNKCNLDILGFVEKVAKDKRFTTVFDVDPKKMLGMAESNYVSCNEVLRIFQWVLKDSKNNQEESIC